MLLYLLSELLEERVLPTDALELVVDPVVVVLAGVPEIPVGLHALLVDKVVNEEQQVGVLHLVGVDANLPANREDVHILQVRVFQVLLHFFHEWVLQMLGLLLFHHSEFIFVEKGLESHTD